MQPDPLLELRWEPHTSCRITASAASTCAPSSQPPTASPAPMGSSLGPPVRGSAESLLRLTGKASAWSWVTWGQGECPRVASTGPGRAFGRTGKRRVLALLVLSPFFRSFHSCFPVPRAPMSHARAPPPSWALPSEGQLFQADL